jgi:hypothetical protein
LLVTDTRILPVASLTKEAFRMARGFFAVALRPVEASA